MLKQITIDNIALISHLEIEFGEGLGVLSGETGAGKSIIVDSLFLLLGAKYDKALLSTGQTNGCVSGLFDVGDATARVMSELGLPEDDQVLLTRKFDADGRSEIRINGKLSTLSILRQVSATLVDISGQGEYMSLADPREQMRILEYYVRHQSAELLPLIANEYAELVKINRQLTELGDEQSRARTIDLIQAQINEISSANVRPEEEDELVELRRKIYNSEKIRTSFNTATGCLDDGEPSAVQLISQARSALNSLHSDDVDALIDRLDQVLVELDDITETLRDELESIDFDDERIDKLEKRLDLIRTLKRKYGTVEQQTQLLATATEQLNNLQNADYLCEQLTAKKQRLLASLYENCCQLSQIRRAGAVRLCAKILAELEQLGMRDARVEIGFCEIPMPGEEFERVVTSRGFDCIEFAFSANPGQAPKSLAKVISGGEMSRFALALKVIQSGVEQIPTLIFDEIDTGISGQIGQEVGRKLARISRHRQVLCVSHLPQIAALADHNYLISKSVSNGLTSTTVTVLDQAGVIEEIARLTGSKDLSPVALQTARDMRDYCDRYKLSLATSATPDID